MTGVYEMPLPEFEEAVSEALDQVPPELTHMMSNVVVLVEDEPGPHLDRELYGVYEGTPLTERGEWWAAGSLPDRITIFRGPTLDVCDTAEDVVGHGRISGVH